MLSDCELNVNYLSQISDKKGVSHIGLCKIADYLDVSLDFLLGRETKSTPNNDIRSAVIERVNLLSDVQAAQLLAFLESITKE